MLFPPLPDVGPASSAPTTHHRFVPSLASRRQDGKIDNDPVESQEREEATEVTEHTEKKEGKKRKTGEVNKFLPSDSCAFASCLSVLLGD